MIAGHAIPFLGVVALLAGCASFDGFPDRPASAGEDLQQLEDAYFAPGYRAEYDAAVGEAERQRTRNEIISGRMAAFDIAFNQFQRNLYRQGVGVNLTADAIVLGLGAAGSVVSGGTSQLLSAASGGVTGLKGAIDRDVFFEKTLPVLLQEMNAQRKRIEVRIREGLSRSTTEYPLSRGLSDLEAYYFAGTIPGSLVGIVESAGAKGAEAEARLLGEFTAEAASGEVIAGATGNIEAIEALSDDQALRLSLILDNAFPRVVPDFASDVDPQGQRFRSGRAARDFAKLVTPTLNRTAEGVERLRKAIELARGS